jgi:hypothetical protein
MGVVEKAAVRAAARSWNEPWSADVARRIVRIANHSIQWRTRTIAREAGTICPGLTVHSGT